LTFDWSERFFAGCGNAAKSLHREKAATGNGI
jgi:hypothetical protein